MEKRNNSRAKILAMTILGLSNMGKAEIEKRHVQLVTPTPFDWAEYGPTNPLRTDGSDYPCKIPHEDTFTINGTATEIAIGEEQTVSFSGWSVHGGGSCQFALTEGHAPTPDSAWKVIQSIEGGCPKADVAGNLTPGQNPDTYTFTIPDDFEPGNYTWAWTWVNKIAAEAEFYMNCAPISVTAAAAAAATGSTTKRGKERRRRRREEKKHLPSSSSRREATPFYPDLFLANIGSASNGCTTSEAVEQQIAIAFPYPGNAVSYPNGQADLFPQACDGNPRNNNSNNGASASTSRGVQSYPASGTTLGSSTSSTAMLATTTSSEAAATSIPVASSSSSMLVTTTATTASSTFNTIVSSVAASSPAAATGTSTQAGGSCTDGYLLCVGGTQFSTCTGGVWDAPQDLAAHTTCEGGEGVGLTIINHY